MKRTRARLAVVAVGAAMATAVAACGSSGTASTGSGGGGGGGTTGSTTSGSTGGGSSGTFAPGGTLKVNMGTFPDSLDPQYGYVAQSSEATWLVYTPLLTYAHASGTAGTTIIPGLASALPVVTNGGKTYTMTLRSGLKYSNGTAVKASDFAYTVERAIKLNWGGASFLTQNIVGALAFSKGTATTISGIKTDDASGKITIKLTNAYGAFENVLSFPAVGLVPTGTPMKPEGTNPPPGVGAYKITSVQPSVSFTLQKNPSFAALNIPGIPTGYVDTVQVTIESNTNTEAQQVLNNQSDEFDWSDTLPPALLSQVQTSAAARYKAETLAGTDYFFLNTKIAPFNNPIARRAADLAINRGAIQRLASGQLNPACYFLPPGIPGYVSGPCVDGSPTSLGSAADIARAKAMITKAGLAGAPVTVWSETRQPRQAYSTYLNSQLNAIGFKSSLKVVSDSIYFQTIGAAKTGAQAGFADWFQDFPNPGDFYLLLDGRAIQPINNENFENVNDPKIQSAIIKLESVPASKLASVAPQWQALEKYVDSQHYMIPYGNLVGPFFLSNRVDYSKAIFQPLFGDDWSSFELTK